MCKLPAVPHLRKYTFLRIFAIESDTMKTIILTHPAFSPDVGFDVRQRSHDNIYLPNDNKNITLKEIHFVTNSCLKPLQEGFPGQRTGSGQEQEVGSSGPENSTFFNNRYGKRQSVHYRMKISIFVQ